MDSFIKRIGISGIYSNLASEPYRAGLYLATVFYYNRKLNDPYTLLLTMNTVKMGRHV
jgi:hypothetical protein